MFGSCVGKSDFGGNWAVNNRSSSFGTQQQNIILPCKTLVLGCPLSFVQKIRERFELCRDLCGVILTRQLDVKDSTGEASISLFGQKDKTNPMVAAIKKVAQYSVEDCIRCIGKIRDFSNTNSDNISNVLVTQFQFCDHQRQGFDLYIYQSYQSGFFLWELNNNPLFGTNTIDLNPIDAFENVDDSGVFEEVFLTIHHLLFRKMCRIKSGNSMSPLKRLEMLEQKVEVIENCLRDTNQTS